MGIGKLPNEALQIFNQRDSTSSPRAHLLSTRVFFVVNLVCQVTLWGAHDLPHPIWFHRDPCQPITLLLSRVKSGPFSAVFSCHFSADPTCPISALHLACLNTGIYKGRTCCQEMHSSCILHTGVHSSFLSFPPSFSLSLPAQWMSWIPLPGSSSSLLQKHHNPGAQRAPSTRFHINFLSQTAELILLTIKTVLYLWLDYLFIHII